ncbi:S8 family serine peptidase [Streptomyces sp. NBC_00887]|uniref:S8 family serine peptidase n=1 Tax=Streptomyces sp. NBC_00887 TaxID=2975859 RepID=UPI00386F91CF|nr:S8 family serine peptidase [Streptomyces sp. NBC_00887]WSY36215.1 S8 family serine peptidase [Streptomyces sp. NBC_00887]
MNGSPGPGRYIVTLADPAISVYRGEVAGIPARASGGGGALDLTNESTARYRKHLVAAHRATAASVGAEIEQQYTAATNGFVADLSITQVARLHQDRRVLSVEPDAEHRTTDDRNSVDFLGLSGRGGVWSELGGTRAAGKGVVVGVIDTGIWPESRSFTGTRLGATPPPVKDPFRPYRKGESIVMRKADGGTFTGTCQSGEEFTADLCNTKLVSARSFGDSWLMAATDQEREAEYLSPRDLVGHGTHTASTAAGRSGVDVRLQGRNFGEISGVAPGAAVASYKALWGGVGMSSDIVAAIDQAVADGVDVLNYSVGTFAESHPDNVVQQAFRNAAASGIFIAASAGNQGPASSSIDNSTPWLTTVAASSAAPYESSLRLGNGRIHVGGSVSVNAPLGPKPLVLAEDVKRADASQGQASACIAGTLDPSKAKGLVVVCDRGVNGRMDKSQEVLRAGGAGMILANFSQDSTDWDLHPVPTVHVEHAAAAAIRTYARTLNATVTLLPGGSSNRPYPQVASFSSRGPSARNHGDLLKPDIAAPGVGILAAVAPGSNHSMKFDFLSGTSMAAPHIAGLAALHLARHPRWSPMAVKSAMMTTTTPTKTAAGTPSTDAFAQGAGHVRPTRMLTPGLIYDSAEHDWLGYLEGLGTDTGTDTPPIAASDLNYPTIAIGKMVGTQTITRTVTATTPGTYRASTDLPGITATVKPAVLHFSKAGQKATFTVTFRQTKAKTGRTVTGALTWSSHRAAVQSTIVITPWSVLAAPVAAGPAGTGSTSFQVTPGAGPITATALGPVTGTPLKDTLTSQKTDQGFRFTVTEKDEAVQFFATCSNPDDEVALLVVRERENGEPAEIVGNTAWLPEHRPVVSVTNLQPGTYTAYVVSLSDKDIPFTFQANFVGPHTSPAPPHTFRVTTPPTHTQPGTPFNLTATWNNIPTDRPATGYISYPQGAGTLITIG